MRKGDAPEGLLWEWEGQRRVWQGAGHCCGQPTGALGDCADHTLELCHPKGEEAGVLVNSRSSLLEAAPGAIGAHGSPGTRT